MKQRNRELQMDGSVFEYDYDVINGTFHFDDGTVLTSHEVTGYITIGSAYAAHKAKTTNLTVKLPPGVTVDLQPKQPATCNCGTYNQNHWADCALVTK